MAYRSLVKAYRSLVMASKDIFQKSKHIFVSFIKLYGMKLNTVISQ